MRINLAHGGSPGASRSLILGQAAAIALAFLAAELVIAMVIERGLLRTREVPSGFRTALVGYAGLGLAALVFLIPVPLILSPWFLQPGALSSRWPSRCGRAFVFVGTWGFVFFYAASWSTFWLTGHFLDSAGFTFWVTRPILLLDWVPNKLLAIGLASSLAATFVLSEALPRWVGRRAASTHRALSGTLALVLLACAAVTVWGEVSFGLGAVRAVIWTRGDRISPALNVLADARLRLWRNPRPTHASPRIGIERRAITPLPAYVASVPRDRVTRWNVIVVVVESLRADQLLAYGADRNVMPAVNALARQARVFRHAYTTATLTHYAWPAILSSHYPLRSATDHIYPRKPEYPRVLLYDILKGVGYHTAIFSSQNEYWGNMFDYLNTSSLDRFEHAATIDGPKLTFPEDTGFASWVKRTRQAGVVDDRSTIAAALQWIDTVRDGPFFLSLNLQSSHLPYYVGPGFPRRFSPEQLDFGLAFGRFPRRQAEIVKGRYADSLAYADTQLATLLGHLRRHGLLDHTVIVVTGDHGQAFYEHDFAAHGNQHYEELARVPLIFWAPGLSGTSDEQPAQHVDVAPSVLDLLGLPPHPSFQGRSVFRKSVRQDRALYMVTHSALGTYYSLVRSGHKLLYDERRGSYRLFDLREDPAEQRDIALFRPQALAALVERLDTWRAAQLDYYRTRSRYTAEYPPILED